MRWGAHLPLVDFGDGHLSARELRDFVRVAGEVGCDTVSANDHLLWRRPWLDGLTTLAAVAGSGPDLTLATSVALPAVRHPVVLAKALASLAVLHAGPVIAGLGPGSSRADHAAVGIPFEERWSRFDAATRIVRSLLAGEDPHDLGLVDGTDSYFAPLTAVAPQIWVASWGSQLRLRAVAAAADGWIASGYNTDPAQYVRSRARLDAELERVGRDPAAVPDMIATMWLYVTDDVAAASSLVEEVLAPALNRDPAVLARWLPIGTAEHCAEVLAGYAEAGARRVLLWPVRDGIRQLQLFGERVAPHIPGRLTE